MHPCDTCARHLLPGTNICPFCAGRVLSRLGAAATVPIILTACYGQPPCTDLVDADGDGFNTCNGGGGFVDDQDCNDADAAIFPGAEETCDNDVDENCDGIVASTELTEICSNTSDDDCDGLLPADDPDCATGTLAISYSFTGATDCADAGMTDQSLAVEITRDDGQRVNTFDEACLDTQMQLADVIVGSHTVSLYGYSGDFERDWTSNEVTALVEADATTSIEVVLQCYSDPADICGQ